MSRCIAHIMLCLLCLSANAQRAELRDNPIVRDSVEATILRERAEGLWSEASTKGELNGRIRLDLVIDDKGRAESVFVVDSDLSVAWKNAIKDHFYDKRFGFKLPKGHREKITIELRFP